MGAADSTTTTMTLERYAADAKAWVVAAQALADERRHAEITPLHLLSAGLDRDPGIAEVFRRAKVDVAELSDAAERALGRAAKADEPAYLSNRLIDLLGRARRDAGSGEVGVAHVLGALTQEVRGATGELLGAFGVGPGSLKSHLEGLRRGESAVSRSAGTGVTAEVTRDLVQQARRGQTDPVIGRDSEVRRLLTILERRHKSHPLLIGEPGVGKGAIIRALARRIAEGEVPTTLARARLLEVELGALVAGARLRGDVEARVRRLVDSAAKEEGDAILVIRGLEQLFGQSGSGAAVGDVLETSLARGAVRLLATTTEEGLGRVRDKDPTFARLLTPLSVAEPTVAEATEIVRGLASRFEIHHGVSISETAIGASAALARRYVQDGFLPDSAIDLLDEAAATLRVDVDGVPPDVDRAMRRLDSLEAQLASVARVDDEATRAVRSRLSREAEALEPEVSKMRDALEARRGALGAVRTLGRELARAKVALEAARAAKDFAAVGELEHATIPELQARFDGAERAAREAGAPEREAVLLEEHVARTLAVWTGIPVAKMLEGEADKLMKMEPRLEQRVVGQHDAVRALARAVRRGRVGLRDPRKPIGSFLFLGPSGVGKTELAKALAQFLFDDERALTRLDMSEFMERHMAQRLLGAPPGYADSDKGGFLTEAVRRRPYSVLLFDEVEKAHQDVFNLLLQVLDDGRLTDGRGRLADFTNTVVIMTSNIGSDRILDTSENVFEDEEGRDALRDVLLNQLGDFFRPEFLNRIDDVIVFRPLARAHLRKIVDIQLDQVRGLLAPRGVTLDVDDGAKDQLVELGYEPALGARPLKRAILRHVQDPVAEALLSGGHGRGASIRVRVDDGALKVAVEGGSAPSPSDANVTNGAE